MARQAQDLWAEVVGGWGFGLQASGGSGRGECCLMAQLDQEMIGALAGGLWVLVFRGEDLSLYIH